ncbi:MAG TPA: DUF3558 family protein [Candidatus Limnocylindria bacterium]|nr:DUF3558 family protein [Candidatus Limnocylindria bacterium]HEX3287759.1 DUF3558 family protein [Mycobacterium sp.]
MSNYSACGRSPRLHAAFVAATALVLALTGCTITPSPSPPQSPASSASTKEVAEVDACALLSPAELADLVGNPAPEPKPVPRSGWNAGQCSWSGPRAAFLVSIGTASSLQLAGDPAVPDARAKLQEFASRMASAGFVKKIRGTGDDAMAGKAAAAAYERDTYVEVVSLHLTAKQLVQILKLLVSKI